MNSDDSKQILEQIDSLDKSINNRINSLDKDINGRIDSLDKSVNSRINHLDKSVNDRIDSLDKDINDRMDSLDSTQLKMFRHMEDMRSSLQQQIDTKANKAETDKILNVLDGIVEKLDNMEMETAAQKSQSNRTEERISRLERKFVS